MSDYVTPPQEQENCVQCGKYGPDCEGHSELASATGSVAWTKTPPAIPGHYWVRFGSRQSMTVLEVEKWHGKMQCYYYQAWRPLGDAKYWHDVEWWPSPITPPPNSALSQGGPATHNTKQEPEPPLAPANG